MAPAPWLERQVSVLESRLLLLAGNGSVLEVRRGGREAGVDVADAGVIVPVPVGVDVPDEDGGSLVSDAEEDESAE